MASQMGVLVWQVLVANAMEHRTITYGDLAKAVGVTPVGVGRYLDEVAEHCEANGLRPLTVIAVNADTGKPSFPYPFDVNSERQRVFEQNWFREPPPSLNI